MEVERRTSFLGEPVAKIVGRLDTQALLDGMLDELGGELQGLGVAPTGAELSSLGDIHATLYVSETTHYLRAAHLSLALEQDGQRASIDLDLSLRDFNERIRIPKPLA